jgi:hypothetical protein
MAIERRLPDRSNSRNKRLRSLRGNDLGEICLMWRILDAGYFQRDRVYPCIGHRLP